MVLGPVESELRRGAREAEGRYLHQKVFFVIWAEFPDNRLVLLELAIKI
jgi:hypothetical protein